MKRVFFPLLCLAALLLFPGKACGAEKSPPQNASAADEQMKISENLDLDPYDLADIQHFLDQVKGSQGMGLSFKALMKDLMEGNLSQVMGQAGMAIKNLLIGEVKTSASMMGQIIILGIIGAAFTNFSNIFERSQISETGFFVTYLLLFAYLAASFFTSVTIAANAVGQILDFTRVLMPAYFLAAAFAGNSASAAVSYEFTLFAIAAAQWLLGQALLFLVRIYALLVMAGNLAKEEMLSKLTELLEEIVSWSLKTLVGLVLGFHLIQSMVLPYVDSMKTGTVRKLLGAIPGLGQGVSSVAQMVLGSGVVIKNSIGAAGIVVLLILSVFPLLKLAVLMLLYQCAAALLQPICDKRMVSCISDMAKGHKMLLSITASGVLLFVVTIALMCSSTNVAYYAG